MKTREFGKTGHQAKLITLGGAGLGYITQEEADKAMKLALKHELNTLDIAPSYGIAEKRIGPWMEKYRNQFFIAEKTAERSYEGVMKELHQSLKNLHSKKFELYQFHHIENENVLNQIFKKGGAYEAFKEAKETGLIDHIGLTTHDNVQLALKAMELIEELDVVLIPVYLAAKVSPDPVNDFSQVLNKALENNIGVTAIKAISQRRWFSEEEKKQHGILTWYKPLQDPEWIEKAVHFTLSQDGVTSYSIPGDPSLWEPVLTAGESFKQMSIEEQELLIQKAKLKQFSPLFPV